MDSSLLLSAAVVLAAYLVASLPMGVIVARITGGRDPRTVGSGRTGGTNAYRAMGWRRGVLVGVLDIGKGAAPVLLARVLALPDAAVAITALAAILGAWKSVFLGFNAGRGVATGTGATLVIQPIAVLVCIPVFLVAVLVSRYTSLGSLLSSAAAGIVLAILVYAGASAPAYLAYAVVGVAFIWIAHADNIDRLIHGRERRIVFSGRHD
jgi:acyl phosphate:glycerol-3-phosphate acyltransferase